MIARRNGRQKRVARSVGDVWMPQGKGWREIHRERKALRADIGRPCSGEDDKCVRFAVMFSVVDETCVGKHRKQRP
jgi:hypothetical protein